MMMITIFAIMTATMASVAKSDETKTITPKEFGTAIAETPAKVANFISNEVDKTKEYQKKSWAEMKTKWPWTMFKKKD